MTHLFIINPQSGNHSINLVLDSIEFLAKKYQLKYKIIITKYPGHVKKIFSDLDSNQNRVYIFGGDGTINDAIQTIDSNLKISFIPIGSGNDFFRYFQSKYSIQDLLEETINGIEVCVDVGQVENKRFMNSFSLGFDADVAYDADKLIRKKTIKRELAYKVAALKNLIKPNFTEIELEFDNQKIVVNTLIFAVLNGRYYGGGFNPTPLAFINDGKLDLCLINKLNHFQIITLLKKYLDGKHLNNKNVQYHQSKHFKIKAEKEFSYEIDGEIYHAKNLEISILEKQLKMIVPKQFINELYFK